MLDGMRFLRRRVVVAAAAAVVAGAGCGNSAADMGCAEIAAALAARAPTVSRACELPEECMNVGHPQAWNGEPTCGQGVAFLLCPGTSVNRVAWMSDDEIAPLFEQWQTRCVPQGASSGAPEGAFDCAPRAADCVAQQCEPTQWCFGDGGVR